MKPLDNSKIIHSILNILLLITSLISILFLVPTKHEITLITVILAYFPLLLIIMLCFMLMYYKSSKNELLISFVTIMYISIYLLSKKIIIELNINKYYIISILVFFQIILYYLSISMFNKESNNYISFISLENTKIFRRFEYTIILIIQIISVDSNNRNLIGILLLIYFILIQVENIILCKTIKKNSIFYLLIVLEGLLHILSIYYYLNSNNIYLFILLINIFKNPFLKRYCVYKS